MTTALILDAALICAVSGRHDSPSQVFTEMAPEPAYGEGGTNAARPFTREMTITLGREWLRATPASLTSMTYEVCADQN